MFIYTIACFPHLIPIKKNLIQHLSHVFDQILDPGNTKNPGIIWRNSNPQDKFCKWKTIQLYPSTTKDNLYKWLVCLEFSSDSGFHHHTEHYVVFYLSGIGSLLNQCIDRVKNKLLPLSSNGFWCMLLMLRSCKCSIVILYNLNVYNVINIFIFK